MYSWEYTQLLAAEQQAQEDGNYSLYHSLRGMQREIELAEDGE